MLIPRLFMKRDQSEVSFMDSMDNMGFVFCASV